MDRRMNLKAEIASLEKQIARKASTSKRAIDDAGIKDMALKVKQDDASSIMSQIKALEKEIEASEKDEEVKADQNDDAMHNNPLADCDGDDDSVMADDEADMKVEASDDDEVMADDEEGMDDMTADVDEILSGLEDDISDTNDQVIEEVKPEAKGEQPVNVVSKKASRNLYASTLKQASERLDRVAAYLEKNGNKKLAFQIDAIADSIDSKLASIK